MATESLRRLEDSLDSRIAALASLSEDQRLLIHFLRLYKRNKSSLAPVKLPSLPTLDSESKEKEREKGAREVSRDKDSKRGEVHDSKSGGGGDTSYADGSLAVSESGGRETDSKGSKDGDSPSYSDMSQLDAILNQARMIRQAQSKAKVAISGQNSSSSSISSTNLKISSAETSSVKSRGDKEISSRLSKAPSATSTAPSKPPRDLAKTSNMKPTALNLKPQSKDANDGNTSSRRSSISSNSSAINTSSQQGKHLSNNNNNNNNDSISNRNQKSGETLKYRSLNQRDVMLHVLRKFDAHKNILNPINLVFPADYAIHQYNILRAIKKTSLCLPSCPLIDCLYEKLMPSDFPKRFISTVNGPVKKDVFDRMTLKIKEMQKKYDKVLKSRIHRCQVDHLDGVDRREVLYNWLFLYSISRIFSISSTKSDSTERLLRQQESKSISILENAEIYLHQIKCSPTVFDVKKLDPSKDGDTLQRIQTQHWRSVVSKHLDRHYLSLSRKVNFISEAMIAREFLQAVLLKIKLLCKTIPYRNRSKVADFAGDSVALLSVEESTEWKNTLKCFRNLFYILTGGSDGRSECFFFSNNPS